MKKYYLGKSNSIDRVEAIWETNELMADVLTFFPNIKDLIIVDKDGFLVNKAGTGSAVNPYYNFLEQPWFPKQNNRLETSYLGPHTQNYYIHDPSGVNKTTISAIIPIIDVLSYNREKYGYIVCNVDASQIDPILNKSWLGSTGVFFIVDNNNTLINNPAGQLYQQEFFQMVLSLCNGENGNNSFHWENKKYASVYNTSSVTGWKLIALIPMEEMLSPLDLNMIKIMFIDDEMPTLDLLENVLDWENLGIEVIGKASNGKEAFELMQENVPDIIITDIQMPYMSGLDLAEKIRSINPQMQIILLSAYSEFEYARKALDFHVTGYLLKPVDEMKLEEMVKRAIKEISQMELVQKSLEFQEKYLQSKAVKELILKDFSENDYSEMIQKSGLQAILKDYYFCLFHLFQENISLTENEFYKINFLPCKNKQSFLIIPLEQNNSYVALIGSENFMGEDTHTIDCNKICSEWQQNFKEKCGMDVGVKMYGPCNEKLSLSKIFRILTNQTLDDFSVIEKTKEYLLTHYHQQVSLNDICQHVMVSKNYLSSLFSQQTHQTIWAFLTEIRIDKAKELLIHTKIRTNEISYKVGYENPNYFSKLFKKATGTTPQNYRMQHKL